MMLNWFARDDSPILVGERVVLRAPRAGDYPAWLALRRASREFLKPFEPRWGDADLAHKVYTARLRRARHEVKAGTDYTFFIFLPQAGGKEVLTGGITLSNVRRRAAQFANLGYWMGQDFAGQGLMSEAVRLVVAYAFDSLSLHRIHAAFLPGNMASRRVLEKNGFGEEGYATNYLQIDGKWADHVLFGLTRERYDAVIKQNRR